MSIFCCGYGRKLSSAIILSDFLSPNIRWVAAITNNSMATTRPKEPSSDIHEHGRALELIHGTLPEDLDRHNFSDLRRIQILSETVEKLSTPEKRALYHQQAAKNLARWAKAATQQPSKTLQLMVLPGDWGDVTAEMTRRYGKTFAVLNMANAYAFGGGYDRGCTAQEENMFRRTDCHFADDLLSPSSRGADGMYGAEATAILQATRDDTKQPVRVYLDTTNPRVCTRGSEDRSHKGLGYPFLETDQVFPFFELRAAAQDLRGKYDNDKFDVRECQRRVDAQMNTLIDAGVRHAILSAFGCGAFQNPADKVAAAYRASIEERKNHFDVIVFAIFHAGYGPDNFKPFQDAFAKGI